MRRVVLVLGLATSCAAPGGAAWSGELASWGTLRAVLRDGEDQARVTLAEVARDDVYALGALAELAGEITIVDGDVWITRGDPETPATTCGSPGDAAAALLFACEVRAWRAFPIEHDIAPDELDAFVERCALRAGLDTTRPFPFLVEGRLTDLALHVVAGECPLRARARGASTRAFELERARLDGRLLGIYAPDSAGVVCPHGSRTHVHALVEQPAPLTGHVERCGIATGSILRLPAE
ncbi:MAG TPA: acetolactate decarboxylase [Planctomycetota bacterium]